MLYNIMFWGVPLAALTVYLVLILFFLISRKDKAIRAFQPILYALALWTASSLLMKAEAQPGVLFWNKMMMVGVFASPFLIYLFLSVFTNTFKLIKTLFLGSLSLILVIVNFMGLIVTDAYTVTRNVVSGGISISQVEFVYSLGNWAIPSYVLMFFTIFAIFAKVKACVTIHEIDFKAVRPILIGVSVSFLGLLFNLIPALGKYPIDILACLINGLLMVYAIYRNRMFEMKFMLTRGIVFSLFSALVMGIYLSVIYFINRFLAPYIKSQEYVIFIIALFIALLFQPLLGLAKKLSELLFYKSEYSQRNALKEFGISISNNLSLTEISNQFVEAVGQAMNPHHTTLLLKDRETCKYKTFQSLQKLNPMEYELEASNPIVEWLCNHNQCLTKNDVRSKVEFRALWDSEVRGLREMNTEVLVPMKCRDELIGIILLTERRNNVSYTLDDLELLRFLGASTAVAISNALLYAKAEENAYTDDMTGIYNRRYFFKYLNKQLLQSEGDSVSLIELDLDRFKLYNELYGFGEGDRAIERVAKIIEKCVDRRGIVARYSGEQFMVVLPRYDSPSAYEIAETIRQKIEQVFFDEQSATKQFLTISAGVCTYPICAINANELVKRGNLALLSAKHKGKNRTVIYTTLQNLENEVSASTRDEKETEDLRTTVYALTAAIDAKDHYTFNHSQNVANYALALAKELGLDAIHQNIIYEAGLLHDVGKIGIPENILTKQEKLTPEEYDVIKKHVDISINIVKHLSSMEHVIPAIVGHHERYNGQGYPRGIAGKNIPIEARCLAVADTFDAITSVRPYKQPYTVEQALSEIEKNEGIHFDPDIARAFVKMVREGRLNITPTLSL